MPSAREELWRRVIDFTCVRSCGEPTLRRKLRYQRVVGTMCGRKLCPTKPPHVTLRGRFDPESVSRTSRVLFRGFDAWRHCAPPNRKCVARIVAAWPWRRVAERYLPDRQIGRGYSVGPFAVVCAVSPLGSGPIGLIQHSREISCQGGAPAAKYFPACPTCSLSSGVPWMARTLRVLRMFGMEHPCPTRNGSGAQ